MGYLISFVMNLKLQGSRLDYNSLEFEGLPLSINIPDLETVVKETVQTFQEVAIVESDKPAIENRSHLSPVSGKAYIFPLKDLETLNLDQLGEKLTHYLKSLVQDLSSQEFMDIESSPKFSTLQQILELRKYLIDIGEKQKKKPYRNGYIYITEN
jgi:hypothetical protein